MTLAWLIVAPLLAICVPANAQQADPFQAAFDAWAQKYKPQTAFAMVQIAGRPVFAQTVNGDFANPTFIGSMSKAITGACIATLIGDGRLAFSTPMKEGLAGFFKKYGTPTDPRFYDVTVEQLLVHRAGLRGNPDGDPIHDMIRKRAEAGQGSDPNIAPMLAAHLSGNKLVREPGTAYAYSNTGYYALSQIIEEKSGRPYEDYCRAAVFEKLGPRGPRLHPEWRVLSGAGGWFVTPADYTAFLKIFDVNHPFLPKAAKDWIDAVRAKWPPADERGSWYSLGVNTHAVYGRWYVTHGGLLNSKGKDRAGKPIDAIVSSNAIRAADGTSLVYGMTPAVGAEAAMGELRTILNKAIDAARAKRS